MAPLKLFGGEGGRKRGVMDLRRGRGKRSYAMTGLLGSGGMSFSQAGKGGQAGRFLWIVDAMNNKPFK